MGRETNIFGHGRLSPEEAQMARQVFRDTVPYSRVFIAPYFLPGSNAPVTLASDSNPLTCFYTIFWDRNVFELGADRVNDYTRRTLVHELTHVWQGHHGVLPTFYMAQSVWAQLKHGIRDIIRRRRWAGWNNHRGTAYEYDPNSLGRPWNEFNVEQQAKIVEDWYSGGMQPTDPRYPYIVCNILTGDRNAGYTPVSVQPAPQAQPLGVGADAAIKEIQDKLVALGYLEARRADGYMGRYTRDAVERFQRRNGLAPDGDIGGVNSRTRARLRLPLEQLRGAQ